ncbi:hypothetical protein [Peribacillus simplex]
MEVFWMNPDYDADQKGPTVQEEQVKSSEDRLDMMEQYLSNS